MSNSECLQDLHIFADDSVFNTIWPRSLPFLLVTLPELDKEIFAIQHRLELSP